MWISNLISHLVSTRETSALNFKWQIPVQRALCLKKQYGIPQIELSTKENPEREGSPLLQNNAVFGCSEIDLESMDFLVNDSFLA